VTVSETVMAFRGVAAVMMEEAIVVVTTESLLFLSVAVAIAGVAATTPTTTMLTVQKVYATCGFFGCMPGTHKNFDTCSCDPD
jgi:hypothetical protein